MIGRSRNAVAASRASALNVDGALGDGDLAAQRGLGDGGDDDVRRQRKVGGLQYEALGFGRSLQRFGRTTRSTPQVQKVGDIEQPGEQPENQTGGIARRRREGGRYLVVRS